MTQFFTGLVWGATYWHWWVLGMILLSIEVFAPGFFFLWLGVAAGVVGVILFFEPSISWQVQIILYALTSLASILVWRLWLQNSVSPPTDQPMLNRRADQYVGHVFTLEQPIVNGRGRVQVEDTWWRVEGKDLPGGCSVRVVASEGVILKVEGV